jgi:bifunctional DNA-binding transcriptional regulator/antitoxin component of YhaV-PrlF toxin-antitoxin module
MERRLIRQRWQITIPGGIRRKLNLYQGQLLNFDLAEIEGELFIRMYTGLAVDPGEAAAFQDVLAAKKRKEKGQKCGRKIRKLEEKRSRRAGAARAVVGSELTTLREIVSDLSQYLLTLQERLKQ